MPKRSNVLTVCSGIGAVEYAWRDLPVKFIGCSEIEPFPSAVLAERYPGVPNYGDMNNYRDWNLHGANVDILAGGTPCQSFSISGLRTGLDSENGNLSLVFIRMAAHFKAKFILFENVPGLLSSSRGRDFSALLSAFRQCGYSIAYRILDAQSSVPQRRKRLFIIGYRGENWRCAAAVLFKPEGLPGDSPKSQGAGKNITAEIENSSGITVYENHGTDSRIKEVKVSPTVTRRWGSGGNNTPLVLHHKSNLIRKITVEEAEELMGFKRGYTNIKFKGKPAANSQRYMALGNSMCVPLVESLGCRMVAAKEAVNG